MNDRTMRAQSEYVHASSKTRGNDHEKVCPDHTPRPDRSGHRHDIELPLGSVQESRCSGAADDAPLREQSVDRSSFAFHPLERLRDDTERKPARRQNAVSSPVVRIDLRITASPIKKAHHYDHDRDDPENSHNRIAPIFGRRPDRVTPRCAGHHRLTVHRDAMPVRGPRLVRPLVRKKCNRPESCPRARDIRARRRRRSPPPRPRRTDRRRSRLRS